jgi:glutathione S-transferase
MAVKLHRCRFEWLKAGPCWRVEKALKEMGVDYELAPGASRPSKRDELIEHTGQRLYPAIEFEDGTWYREESRDMETTIRDGRLFERGAGAVVHDIP